ncbi:MAG: PEP/pyruvate-binding domain-containing protein [Eubacteriales bacterium]
MNIYELDKIPSDALNSVGGKARGLRLLSTNRLHVPEGFVITDIHSEVDLKAAVDYYTQSGLTRVAVRSSVLGEDTIDFSYAGLYDTFLNLEGADAVKRGIQNCLISLNSAKARHYSQLFTNPKPNKMCVIVQKMVDAEISGVCFTESPMDADILTIDAVAGLGDQLMGGVAAPHSYRIKSNDSNPTGDALIDSKLLSKIAKEARHASVELGYPLDLEWAVCCGELYWLQARPITTKDFQDVSEFDSQVMSDKHVYVMSRIQDVFPTAVTPLTLSTVVKALDTSIRTTMVNVGLAKKIDSIPEGSGVASFSNRLFFNLTEISKIGTKQPDGSEQLIQVSLCGKTLDDTKPRGWDLPLADFAVNMRRNFNAVDSSKNAYKQIKKLVDSFDIELWGKSLKWQIEEIDGKLDALNIAFLDYYKNLSASLDLNGALYLIFLKSGMTPQEARELQVECLSGIPEIETFDILHMLKKLTRELVLDDPKIANASLEEISARVSNVEGDSKKALETFYASHGHRGILEMELKNKSWQMNNDDLSAYIRSIISTNLTNANESTRAPKYLRTIESKFDSAVQAPLKHLIEQARQAMVVNQLTRSMCVRVLSKFKAAYHFLGKMMFDRKVIPDSDLIFFMTHSEILDFIVKNDFEFVKNIVYKPELIKKAFARKRVFQQQKMARFNEINVGKPEIIDDTDFVPGQRLLQGIPSTPGKVEGTARVIHDLGDMAQLDLNDILITPCSDIGWSPYFNLAGGFISEAGSIMSHGAIVAREFSIPHITSAKYATRLIKTGDKISMDATTGEIKIL